MINAISFDVEEWYHRNDLDIPAHRIDGNRGKVVEDVGKILHLLRCYRTKATFFIVGSLAEEYPEMVQKISEEGHEIASHSYNHHLVYKQKPEEFRKDLRMSISVLEKVSGKRVLGYRAPSWSITEESSWALDIMKEEGLWYDSSIFPVKTPLYGISNADIYPGEIRSGLLEFPVSIGICLGKKIPFTSGIFFRLMPCWLMRTFGRDTNIQNQAFIVNIHTWEMESFKERLKIARHQGIRYRTKFSFLGKTERKLKMMLNSFTFAPVKEVIGICNEG